MQKRKEKLKIISLGGLNEIGKNMTVYEYGEDIIVIDCGLGFPDDEMLGIDIVIPDVSYLVKNKERVRGIFLTHAHEDHIGALPYVLNQINVPIYGSDFTLGMVKKKLEENGIADKVEMIPLVEKVRAKAGVFEIEPIRVNHSVVASFAFAIHTPVGIIVHTGDFKIDSTPIEGEMIDLTRFGDLGRQGVTALLSDSTNVERPGYSMSEKKVGETFDNIFKVCDKRIIVATFSSNIHRIQQVINAAVKFGRKVAISGRSMENILEVATELNYFHVPEGLIVDLNSIDRYPKNKIAIVTTGSQGEPMSALHRMAYSDHKKVEITSEDLVIISSTPIPGNEKPISNMVNELYRKGAEVIYESLNEVHVSGHACQEELKIMIGLCKPKYFMPVHGEYRHLVRNGALAKSVGVESQNVIISDIGKVVEMDRSAWRFNGTASSGRVMVDGLGVGDVGNIVLRDRMHLSQDGLIVVVVTMDSSTGEVLAGPDIVSRGFVYVRDSEELMEELRKNCREALDGCVKNSVKDWATIKFKLKESVDGLIFEKTKRKPMILPVIMEV